MRNLVVANPSERSVANFSFHDAEPFRIVERAGTISL